MTVSTPPPPSSWFNRTTVGISLASLFSDVSHELATAVLPMVILGLGAGPAALGLMEGAADGLSSAAKLWGGLKTDRLERRKPLAMAGYLITALGTAGVGLCTTSWQVLACRVTAWLGRGSRSAARDVLMSNAAPAHSQGKAFGMERAGDTLGAVLGPLGALWLMSLGTPAHRVMLWSLVPGLAAWACLALLVKETPQPAPAHPRTFAASLQGTGAPFGRCLAAVFAFGCGDFSRTLLILYATQHATAGVWDWSAAVFGISLYVLHNMVGSAVAFPLGALTDALGRRPVLLLGYSLAVLTTLAFALLPATPGVLMMLFASSAVYVACQDVAEKAYAAQLLPKAFKGTGMGMLAATNGVGDMVSSAMVGGLWALFPAAPQVGFFAAAVLQLLGVVLLGLMPRGEIPTTVGIAPAS